MNTSKKFLVISFMIAYLTGCAFTTDRIELQYSPQSGVSPVAGADNVSVAVKVVDLRQDKSKVSSKKNGYGMETAPILANEDVTVTVQKAIQTELRARGFRLEEHSANVEIVTDLIRFYNDHKAGFFAGDARADLNMTVQVKSKKGESLYLRQIAAQGSEENIQLPSGDNARLALNRSLNNAIRILFADREFLSALLKTK